MTDTPSPRPEEMTIVTIQVPGRGALTIEGRLPEVYSRELPWDQLLAMIGREIAEYATLRTLQTTWREVNDGA